MLPSCVLCRGLFTSDICHLSGFAGTKPQGVPVHRTKRPSTIHFRTSSSPRRGILQLYSASILLPPILETTDSSSLDPPTLHTLCDAILLYGFHPGYLQWPPHLALSILPQGVGKETRTVSLVPGFSPLHVLKHHSCLSLCPLFLFRVQ